MIKHRCSIGALRLASQRGVAAVEFALVAIIFLTMLFGVIEFARLLFTWSSMQEVTRRVARTASVTTFVGPAIEDAKKAIIAADPGGVSRLYGRELTVDRIQVRYLNSLLGVVGTPASPDVNITTCRNNPASPSCIRFVRVRICQAGTDCTPVEFKPVVPIFPAVTMPVFPVVTPAQSLGCTPPCTG